MKNQSLTCDARFNDPVYTGREHSLAYAYYACDDEVVEDVTDLDQAAILQYEVEESEARYDY